MMKRNLLIIGMAVISAPCFAMKPTAEPPVVPGATPPSAADSQTAAATRDDSSGMRQGAIEAVSVGGGTFHVYGQSLTFDSKRVKVYGRDGKPTSLFALRKGSTIRFTLDPTDPMHRRVAVIYID
jgi:hypothetical protein